MMLSIVKPRSLKVSPDLRTGRFSGKIWTIAFEITLVDKTIISIPYTIYAKDRVFEYLLNVCGLDKKKI